jgi:heterokaryon incompatibility protein (HET)
MIMMDEQFSFSPLLQQPRAKMEGLCRTCRKIDLIAAFQEKVESDIGNLIADIGKSQKTLQRARCAMCRFFGSVFETALRDNGPYRFQRFQLRAYSAKHEFMDYDSREMKEVTDTTLLGVVSEDHVLATLKDTGYLYLTPANQQQQPIFGARLLQSESFYVKFAADCLAYCQTNHGRRCRPSKTASLVNLRVIDCQTRAIVDAPPGCQYLALSYVWGQCTSTSLDDAPRVVNHSIDVTQALHFRYLWIDRYCIDQSNDIDKDSQILQMDMIYSGAQTTIIAAAGHDPHHGLPGVGGTPRTTQPHFKFGDYSIISTMSHPKPLVTHSKWASRGWTYQEGLLSKRRLIFTEQQVFFECNSMHYAEVMVQGLDIMHRKNRRRFRAHIPPGAFSYKDPGREPWDVFVSLSEFSERQLGYPGDTIRAFQGIFNVFSRSDHPVYHFGGVPIPPPWQVRAKVPESMGRDPEGSFIIALCWTLRRSAERRPQFPSWSWAGWDGELSESLWTFDELSTFMLDDISLWIEEDDGSLIRFPKWELIPSFLVDRTLNANKFIHIEANTIEFSIVQLNKTFLTSDTVKQDQYAAIDNIPEYGSYAKIHVEEDSFIYLLLWIHSEKWDLTRRVSGILIGEESSDLLPKFALVVGETDTSAERIGWLKFYVFFISQGDEWIAADDSTAGGWFEKVPKERRKIRLG